MEPDGLLPLRGAELVMPPPVGHAGELVGHGLGLYLLAVLIELDVGVHPGLDNQRVEGLYDIVHRPQGEAPLFVLDGSQAGNEDYRDVLGNQLLLQLFQQVKAVHIRHNHIQQNEGILPGAGLGQPVRRRVDSGYIIIIIQNGLQLGSLYNAVVNNQYLFHYYTPCPGFPPSWRLGRTTSGQAH